MDLASAAASLIRHRDSEGRDPKGPYLEIAPPEADSYLPRFSVFERVPITHNVILKLPAPVEIAASKVAFADRIDRIKDLQDIKFIQEKFQIKNLVFTDPSRYNGSRGICEPPGLRFMRPKTVRISRANRANSEPQDAFNGWF
jgi:hypothetical protein